MRYLRFAALALVAGLLAGCQSLPVGGSPETNAYAALGAYEAVLPTARSYVEQPLCEDGQVVACADEELVRDIQEAVRDAQGYRERLHDLVTIEGDPDQEDLVRYTRLLRRALAEVERNLAESE